MILLTISHRPSHLPPLVGNDKLGGEGIIRKILLAIALEAGMAAAMTGRRSRQEGNLLYV
jgi:hypothetical protein